MLGIMLELVINIRSTKIGRRLFRNVGIR